jgi:predicted nucleic-acid-binding Zn-ribbon protein
MRRFLRESQEERMEACTKCRSTQVITDGVIFDTTRNSTVRLAAGFQKDPSAWIFTGDVRAEIRAVICGACGFMELFANDALRLYEAYSAHKASGE